METKRIDEIGAMIERLVRKLADELERRGFRVVVCESARSESRYLYCKTEDDCFRIRVAAHDQVHPMSMGCCSLDVRGTVELAEAELARSLASRGLQPIQLPAECFLGLPARRAATPQKPRKPELTNDERAVYEAILKGDRSALDRASRAVLLRVILSGAATSRATKDAARARLARSTGRLF
jgi:hypothetical protein